MVSRKSAAAFIAFGIVYASMFAAAHDGRSKNDDNKGKSASAHDRRSKGDDDGGSDEARIRRGFEIAPVPLHYPKKDRDLVGLGSYIVNAQGGCNDCHTNPPYATGGDPFAGEPKVVNSTRYLAGGTPFGPFISRNLTPDATSGRPANLTFDEFEEVIRTGVDLKHRPPHVPSEANDLLQVMPWPVYQDMIDRDLLAIYKYLSAIPHAEPGT